MRRDLLPLLVCPLHKATLTLAATDADEVEVRAGTLTCAACPRPYAIEAGVVNLLPADLTADGADA